MAVSAPLVFKETAAKGALERQLVTVDLLVALQVAQPAEDENVRAGDVKCRTCDKCRGGYLLSCFSGFHFYLKVKRQHMGTGASQSMTIKFLLFNSKNAHS